MRIADKNLAVQRNEEFAARERLPTVAQFVILFFVNFLVVSAAYLLARDTYLQFALITFVMLLLTNAIMVWSIQRNRDLVLMTEFQNALFASALSMHSHFCLIIRRDGVVVYTDIGFRTMFPQFEKSLQRTLDDILDMAHVSKEDNDRLFHNITTNTSGTQIITLRDADGISHKMVIYVDPLRRPQDYMLLRGRPFIENRTQTALKA